MAIISAMELKVLENIESALSRGKLTSIVDEQRGVKLECLAVLSLPDYGSRGGRW